MELDELKANWNLLNDRLAASEVVNLRLVKEMITQKTKSAYDHIVGQNIYSFVINMLIICVVFPYVYMNTPIRTASFAVCLAIVAFYILELGFNTEAGYVLGTKLILPLGLSLMTFALGFVLAKWQLRRHAQQLREIERGLEELKEFED